MRTQLAVAWIVCALTACSAAAHPAPANVGTVANTIVCHDALGQSPARLAAVVRELSSAAKVDAVLALATVNDVCRLRPDIPVNWVVMHSGDPNVQRTGYLNGYPGGNPPDSPRPSTTIP